MSPVQHSSPKMQPVPLAPQVPGEQRPSEQMLPAQQSACVEQEPFVGVQEVAPPQTPLVHSSGLAHSPLPVQRTPAGPGVAWQLGGRPGALPRQ